MKRIPIDECPAGPEIDAAAGRVLGWQRASDGFTRTWLSPGGSRIPNDDWIPSTDIAAAWELAINPPESSNHVAVYLLSVSQNITGDWRARFGEQSMAIGDTAPLAITRAYLKAKGIKFVEVEE